MQGVEIGLPCMVLLMSALSSSRFHQIPDALWERLDLLIPVYAKSPKGGHTYFQEWTKLGVFQELARHGLTRCPQPRSSSPAGSHALAPRRKCFPVCKMKVTSLVHSSRAKMGRPTPSSRLAGKVGQRSNMGIEAALTAHA